MDVICGRGKSGFNHPGNLRFRTAVMQALDDYQHAEDRVGKPVIVHAIISNTYSTGGRFLRRAMSHATSSSSSSTTWVELTFQEQKDKVRHALRDAIAEMKLKKIKAAAQSMHDQQQQQHQWLLTQLSNTTTKTTNHQRSTSPTSDDVLPVVPLTASVSNGSRCTIVSSTTTPSLAARIWQHQATNAIGQNLMALNTTRTPTAISSTSAVVGSGMDESVTSSNSSSNTATMALALQQLTAQLQAAAALQLYQQIKNEQQEQQQQQRIQEYLRYNADQLAIQRDVMALQAYIANLQG
jgi:D-ribose pyranose/furanose isomerase RbsD